jgi:hypothetical protein
VQLILFADIQIGQHALLDAANRGAGHLKLAAPAGGRLRPQNLAYGCQGRAHHESLVSEGLQEQALVDRRATKAPRVRCELERRGCWASSSRQA